MIARAARRLRHRLAGPAPDDRGFSLLEVMVAFVMFSVIAASATRAIVLSLQASHRTQQTVDGANVAQSFIASTQANTILVRAEVAKTYPAAVQNEEFVVTRSITFVPSRAIQCTPGITFTVNVSVAQKQTGRFVARSDAVVTC